MPRTIQSAVPHSALWALSVLLALLFGSTCATAAQAAGPLTWGGPRLIDHELRPAWRLNSVSCPTTSLCVAVDESGHVLTSTDPAGGAGAWSAPVSIDPGNTLDQVSCPSTSLCVAVDDDGNALVSTDPTGGSSAWKVTKIDPNAEQPLGGNSAAVVACPTVSFCVVVDTYNDIITTTEPTGGSSAWKLSGDTYRVITNWGMVACPSTELCVTARSVAEEGTSFYGSTEPAGGFNTWKITGPDPNDVNNEISGGACPSTTLCVIGDATGHVLTTTKPAEGPWTNTNLPTTTFLRAVTGLSCPSTGFCVAVDAEGEAVTTTEPTSGEHAWTPADVDGTNFMTAVSCPTTSFCVATDEGGDIVTSENPAGGSSAWTAGTVDKSEVETVNGLTGVACATAALHCVAVDDAGYALVSNEPTGGAGTWSRTVIDRGPFAGNVLSDVSCGKNDCAAVDWAGNMLSAFMGEPNIWTRAEVDPSGELNGISCPTLDIGVPQYCVAVDSAGNVVTGQPGAMEASRHIDASSLNGVNCPDFNESLCVAVDNEGNVLTTTEVLSKGATWQSAHIDASPLVAVSCSTTAFCAAVDQAGNVLVSSKPTGAASAWTLAHVVSASAPANAEIFTSIACPFNPANVAEPLCVAVNVNGDVVTSTDPLAGGAASWTMSNIDDTGLTAVTCPSLNLCLAVDRQGRLLSGRGSEAPAPKEEPPHEPPTKTETKSSEPLSGTGSSITSAQLKVSLTRQLGAVKVPSVAFLLKHGGYSFSFDALTAGRLSVQWLYLPPGAKLARHSKTKPVLVASGQASFAAPGTGQVKLKLTAQGKRLLRRGKHVRIMAKGTFKGNSGATLSVVEGLRLGR